MNTGLTTNHRTEQGIPFWREAELTSESLLLKKRTAVIQALGDDRGRPKFGLVVHLAPGSEVRVCGPGFSAQTVKISCEHAAYYVHRKSIQV